MLTRLCHICGKECDERRMRGDRIWPKIKVCPSCFNTCARCGKKDDNVFRRRYCSKCVSVAKPQRDDFTPRRTYGHTNVGKWKVPVSPVTGEQYRSVIFYHDDKQKNVAESVKHRLDRENTFGKPIVTTIEPSSAFYPAEDYHKEYYKNNPDQPYCQAVISPKVAKLRATYANLLKE